MKLRIIASERELVFDLRLSRRNLLALLHKLELNKDSACTLTIQESDVLLVVRAEQDDEHYRDRPQAGALSPETEVALRARLQPLPPERGGRESSDGGDA